MADHALRGVHMGFTPLESEEGIAFVERRIVDYICPAGHTFDVIFAIDAKVPDVWDYPQRSQKALRAGAEDLAEEKTIKPQKTHWEQLWGRRSIEELDVLLGERLGTYRSGRRR